MTPYEIRREVRRRLEAAARAEEVFDVCVGAVGALDDLLNWLNREPEYIAIVPNHWARGATPDAALDAAHKLAGVRKKTVPWQIHRVHPETYVDDGGNWCRPEDTPAPELAAEYKPKSRPKVRKPKRARPA